MKPISEELKQKIRKIIALAEGGTDGERTVASVKLQTLLQENGLTLDDFKEDKEQRYIFNVGALQWRVDLFLQIAMKVKNTNKISYWKTYRRSQVQISCTEAQKNEIQNLFNWHSKNLKKEIDKTIHNLITAYELKHRLFNEKSDDNEQDNDSERKIDYEKLMQIMTLQSVLSNERYHKQITQ